MDQRLAARVEVAAVVRLAQQEGGFASVLRKGEPDAGTILIVLTDRGQNPRLFERMPSADGGRVWTQISSQTVEKYGNAEDYQQRRAQQDPDLWIVELDIANGERLIGLI